MSAPLAVACTLWLAGSVAWAFGFVSASSSAKAAASNTTIAYQILGIPILEGFRNGSRFGVHLQWGTLVLVIGPFVIGLVVVLAQLSLAERQK